MLEFKLHHVSKRGHRWCSLWVLGRTLIIRDSIELMANWYFSNFKLIMNFRQIYSTVITPPSASGCYMEVKAIKVYHILQEMPSMHDKACINYVHLICTQDCITFPIFTSKLKLLHFPVCGFKNIVVDIYEYTDQWTLHHWPFPNSPVCEGVIKWKYFLHHLLFVRGIQWIHLRKPSDVELWCFLWCAPE